VLLLGHVHYKRGLILFMKKYILSGIVTLVCVISLVSLQSARAAVTPTNGTTNVYTKVSSDAVATVVGQPQMSLSYDANHNESRLAAVFTVSITGGITPINIYQRAYGMTLIDSHGVTVQANSLGNLTLRPQQAVAQGMDDYSQLFYIVPAGQTVRFIAVGSANPQELFAGTYRAAIVSILANSTSVINNEFNLQFTNKIQTNAVTIVGETSPYITSVTDPATVGQKMIINGVRLSNPKSFDIVTIDGKNLAVAVDGSKDGTSLFFTLPPLDPSINHYLYTTDTATFARSNTVSFRVQVGTTTCNGYYFANNLTFGSTGNDVAALQKLLIANGYHIADVENGFGVGFFGTSTKQAVAAFQAFAGINVAPEDLGFVGPLTRAALNALGCVPPPNNLISVINSPDFPSQTIAINTPNQILGAIDIVNNSGKAYYIGKAIFSFTIAGRVCVAGAVCDPGGTAADLPEVTLVDQNGVVVGSPFNTALSGDHSAVFTDGFVLPTGKSRFILKGKLNSNFVAGQSISAYTVPSNWAALPVGQSGTSAGLPGVTTGPVYMSSMFVGNNLNKPSITVVSPNGGEVINIGQSYTVKWSSTSKYGGVELYVVNPATSKSYPISACCISVSSGQFLWPSIGQGLGETPAIPPGQYVLGIKYYPTDSIGNSLPSTGDVSDAPFTITSPCTASGTVPVICGVTAPTQLNVNQQGTWSVQASDPQNGPLSYAVDWGDTGATACSPAVPQANFVQTTTFTHGYCAAGVYNVTFTVTNSAGLSAKTSSTVNVVGNTSGNNPPKIVTSSSPAGSILVGTSYTFNWTASDVDNDNLSWGISSWGDGSPAQAGTCPSNLANSSFSASHTWMATGTYQIRVFVSDCKGGSDTAVQTVTVAPAIRVLSPNGGEVWNAGSVHSIRWLGNNQGRHISIRLNDYSAGFPAQTIIRDASAVWGSNPQDSRNVTEGFDYFAWNIPSDIRPGSQYQISVGDQTVNAPNFSNTDVSDAYFTIVGPSVNNAQANLSVDAATPPTRTVPVSDTVNGQYLGLPILVFDVNAQNDSLHLHEVKVGVPAKGSGSIAAAYLYNGSTQVSSASIVNGVADFQNISDNTVGASISANTTVPYTVKVDIAGLTTGSMTLVGSMANNQIIYNSSDNPANVIGTAQGNPITVVGTGPVFTQIGDPTITKSVLNSDPSGNVNMLYTATFNVSAQAVGTDVKLDMSTSFLPAVLTTADYIQLYKNGAPDILSNYTPLITYYQPAGTVLSSDGSSFTIPRNSSATLQIVVKFIVWNPGANNYSIQLKGIGYTAPTGGHKIAPIYSRTTSVQNPAPAPAPIQTPGSNYYYAPTPTPKATTYSSSVWDAIMNWLSGR